MVKTILDGQKSCVRCDWGVEHPVMLSAK
jgi:hypothetical protein